MKMNVIQKSTLQTLIVPVGIGLALAPFSMLIGWNLLTLFLFWFIIIPALAVYLPKVISSKQSYIWESLIGLVLFYATMTVMIYDHSNSDYFQVMMVSFVINLIITTIASLYERLKLQVPLN